MQKFQLRLPTGKKLVSWAFIEPLTFIMNQIGWNIDRSYGTQMTLEDFFS